MCLHYNEAAEYFGLSVEEIQGIIASSDEDQSHVAGDAHPNNCNTRRDILEFISNREVQDQSTDKTDYSESNKLQSGKRRMLKKLGFRVYHCYFMTWTRSLKNDRQKGDDEVVRDLIRRGLSNGRGFSQVEIRATLPNLGGYRCDRIMKQMRSQYIPDYNTEESTNPRIIVVTGKDTRENISVDEKGTSPKPEDNITVAISTSVDVLTETISNLVVTDVATNKSEEENRSNETFGNNNVFTLDTSDSITSSVLMVAEPIIIPVRRSTRNRRINSKFRL
jgi:hypothetical protein